MRLNISHFPNLSNQKQTFFNKNRKKALFAPETVRKGYRRIPKTSLKKQLAAVKYLSSKKTGKSISTILLTVYDAKSE